MPDDLAHGDIRPRQAAGGARVWEARSRGDADEGRHAWRSSLGDKVKAHSDGTPAGAFPSVSSLFAGMRAGQEIERGKTRRRSCVTRTELASIR